MASSKTGTFANPVLPGFNPDPSVIRAGNDFFCVTSSFEYFPGVPIYHSKDLIKWVLIGHALTRKSQLDIKTPEPGGGVWATTIRYHNGEFYIITNSFDRYRPQIDDRVWPRGFYVKTSNIWNDSSWSDPVYFDQVGFDFDLFWDDDGVVYLSSCYRKIDRSPDPKIRDFAVHISTVDLKSGTLTSRPRMIRDSASGFAEGSHLFKRNGYYYLFTAEGGTESGHCEYVTRSREGPFGPWEAAPHNPLWRNTTDDDIQNTGHCDVVEDSQGQWWAMCLGVRPRREGSSWRTSVFGRESMLLPVRWENDWPIFNEGKAVALRMEAPNGYVVEDDKRWRDDFTGIKLGLGWYRKNTPVRQDFSMTARSNELTLYGGPYTLSMPACPTLFLRKQKHWPVIWETQLDFQPEARRVEAGTVVWWNHTCYASIGITLVERDGRLQRAVRLTDPDKEVKEAVISEQGAVKLIIESTETSYRLGYRDVNHDAHEANESWTWLGNIDTQVMTRAPEVGQPFTGMMMGLYSFGEMQPVLSPAHFAYAEFR
ncbi:glycoside hydrolase family 43 protein [Bipolaris victoriae FI3]|uniref:Glycoside hydrolase family 43 protein n=1 Tax=Bipolaris victoriae (strain FI3) TaxID=930091 RepID=W7E0J3_BIPV3|nr:glycoside hydrolase family 43 protein [Bipolaris victoriae FI3]